MPLRIVNTYIYACKCIILYIIHTYVCYTEVTKSQWIVNIFQRSMWYE